MVNEEIVRIIAIFSMLAAILHFIFNFSELDLFTIGACLVTVIAGVTIMYLLHLEVENTRKKS